MPRAKYRIISFGQQMGIGVAGSWQATISCVVKTNSRNAPYCIANELICAEVGRFLCLPIPPAGLIQAPQAPTQVWFASLDFNLTGNALPPVDPVACCTRLPDLSTGLLLFDVLIANCDRHRNNFAVDFLSRPVEMNIYDHSHALFGFIAGQGKQRLGDLCERLGISGGSHTHGNRHCLLDVLATDAQFGKWLERISSLPDFLIEEICSDIVGFGATAEEAEAAISFLKYRRDNLQTIIETHRGEFRAIQQWSLFS